MSMVIVFGSINVDLIMRVPHHPDAGETVLTPTYEWLPGGKGANQAVACSRAGVKTAMVGQVGDDGFGTRMMMTLKRNEVWTSGVAHHDTEPTGMAFITIDKKGENRIVVSTGANAATYADQLPNDILGPKNVVLMQMEIDHAQNWDVVHRAKAKGAKTILNLAPAGAIPRDVLNDLDYLIVNQIEGRQIAEKMKLKIEDDAIKMATTLAKSADLTCVMTLGPKGCVAVQPDGSGWRVQALPLGELAVDTTGAGDTFCGVFAASIFEKRPLDDALRRSSVAASLACMGVGAQTAMPHKEAIEEALADLPAAQAI